MVGKVVDIDHPDLAGLNLKMAIHDPEVDFPVSSVLDRTGAWEAFLTRQMRALLDAAEPAVFYDIGANIGWYSLVLARHLQQAGRHGRVFAVEPSSANRSCLAHSVTLNGLDGVIEVVEGAASDRTGPITLALDPVNAGNHRVAGPGAADATAETVSAYRLDDLAAAKGWPPPGLIKADVQGHEMEALRGFLGTLAKTQSWVLAIEWIPGEWSLGDLVSMVGADAIYQVDEQSRRIVPSSAAHLRALRGHWPSSYFDLLLTRGAAAERAVQALPDHEDRFQFRFVRGAGALMQNDRRTVKDSTLARIDPLCAGQAAVPVTLKIPVLWTRGDLKVAIRTKGSDGSDTRVTAVRGETAEIPVTVGRETAWLGIRLHGTPPEGVEAVASIGPIEVVG